MFRRRPGEKHEAAMSMVLWSVLVAVAVTGALPTPAPTYSSCSSLAFRRGVISTSQTIPKDAQVGDFDSDGDEDVVACSVSSDTVNWYENDGQGTWTTHSISTTLNAAVVVASDLDADGDIDILVHETTAIHWIENLHGLGTDWTTHSIKATASSALDMFAVDIDSDSDIDALYVDSGARTVSWFENTGTLTDATEHYVSTAFGAEVKGVVAGDVDGKTLLKM